MSWPCWRLRRHFTAACVAGVHCRLCRWGCRSRRPRHDGVPGPLYRTGHTAATAWRPVRLAGRVTGASGHRRQRPLHGGLSGWPAVSPAPAATAWRPVRPAGRVTGASGHRRCRIWAEVGRTEQEMARWRSAGWASPAETLERWRGVAQRPGKSPVASVVKVRVCGAPSVRPSAGRKNAAWWRHRRSRGACRYRECRRASSARAAPALPAGKSCITGAAASRLHFCQSSGRRCQAASTLPRRMVGRSAAGSSPTDPVSSIELADAGGGRDVGGQLSPSAVPEPVTEAGGSRTARAGRARCRKCRHQHVAAAAGDGLCQRATGAPTRRRCNTRQSCLKQSVGVSLTKISST